MFFEKTKPYNDLPELPPERELETNKVLKQCIKARAALAELKGIGDTIPNQALLIRSIGLQEARVSSEIENIVTTTDDLYQALADSLDKADPAAKEVLRYQEALNAGCQSIISKPVLTTALFCEIASTIKRVEMSVRTLPGTKIVDGRTKEVIYTPPEGESIIRDKLANLEKFIHEETAIDPLVKLALIHYQFEAIHPFSDGNGRTGRIINILFLLQQNLLKMPVLYLSRYLIQNKNEYYSGLRMVTEEGNWEDWIMYMLQAVEQTALETRSKVLDIKQAMDYTRREIKSKLPKIYSKDLVELLFYYPYCKIKFLEERGIAGRQTSATYLNSLVDIGQLVSLRVGRDKYFINKRLLDILAT